MNSILQAPVRSITSLFFLTLFSCQSMAQEADPPSESIESEAVAEGKEEKDPDRGRFLALPFFITEPAIGEGLGGAVMYFHGKKDKDEPTISTANDIGKTDRKSKPPTTVTGLFAFGTNNDTVGAGLVHRRTFRDDLYRFLTVAAYADIHTALYVRDFPLNFSMEGNFFYSNLKRRIVGSNFFVGLSASVANATIDFDFRPGDQRDSGIGDFSFTNTGLAGSVIYDGRDNTSMPNSGQLVDITYWRYDEAVGGDFDYWKSRLKIHSFHEFGDKFVLGLRLDMEQEGGNTPFFAEPYVRLRGIAALRYQGESAGAVEVEGRYQFSSRWAAVAFAGAGFADSKYPVVETEDDIRTYGAGIRFLALKEKNTWLGVDVARGPEDTAFYIQLGHAW
jgi:hypothetical protein